MKTYTLIDILDMNNEEIEELENSLSSDEIDLILEQYKEYCEFRSPQEEFLHDYLEMRNALRRLDHVMEYPETEAMREAIFASFELDWKNCRSWLEAYFSYNTPEILQKLDMSKWDYRHIFNWFRMLINTDLYKESDGTPAHIFFQMILEEGTIVRPSKLRAKFEKEIKQASVQLDGLEELMRDMFQVVQ